MKEKRPHILVVEDDAALAAMYRTTLRCAGFDIHVAADAITALRRIDQAPPDLIVLDLHLPGLGGDTILSEIAASPLLQGIPVIVVTGGDAETAIAQAKAVLRKPCDPTRLVSLIERHLGRAA